MRTTETDRTRHLIGPFSDHLPGYQWTWGRSSVAPAWRLIDRHRDSVAPRKYSIFYPFDDLSAWMTCSRRSNSHRWHHCSVTSSADGVLFCENAWWHSACIETRILFDRFMDCIALRKSVAYIAHFRVVYILTSLYSLSYPDLVIWFAHSFVLYCGPSDNSLWRRWW